MGHLRNAVQSYGEAKIHKGDLSPILGCKDIATKCVELLRTPNALLEFYLDLIKTQSVSDTEVRAFALFMLARLTLDLPLNSKYTDRLYPDALENSSTINVIFGFLPDNLKERFVTHNPFSGFRPFIADKDVSSSESDRTLSVLGPRSEYGCIDFQIKATTFQSALGILLEAEHSINEDLGDRKLSTDTQMKSNQQTANLIYGLGHYFSQCDYGSLHYHQLIVIAESIAYVKRFYRDYWCVEAEDVLEAWFFINYFKKPRPPRSQSAKRILNYISKHNSEGKFPTQRQIIKETGLSIKVVSNAVGLKIKRPEGSGKLLTQGYVEYDIDREGYKLTQLGELALTNDFHISVDGTTFRPKSILDGVEW